MSCTRPQKVIKPGYVNVYIAVKCGVCMSCRLEYSREWATRCEHERQLHEKNCYLTLTYNPEHLPIGGTLVKEDLRLFFKRLRKKYGSGIRYFACGEYGENFDRPHYHAIVFNHDFDDKYIHYTNNGFKLYRSEELEKLWKKGYSDIGEVTWKSAAYVARYMVKKINGKNSEEHYKSVCKETGLEIIKQKEFATMSNRPGIGKEWIDMYMSDVYPEDKVIVKKGLITKPCRYYDKQYKKVSGIMSLKHPTPFRLIKERRQARIKLEELKPERLKTKENIQERKARKLIKHI